MKCLHTACLQVMLWSTSVSSISSNRNLKRGPRRGLCDPETGDVEGNRTDPTAFQASVIKIEEPDMSDDTRDYIRRLAVCKFAYGAPRYGVKQIVPRSLEPSARDEGAVPQRNCTVVRGINNCVDESARNSQDLQVFHDETRKRATSL